MRTFPTMSAQQHPVPSETLKANFDIDANLFQYLASLRAENDALHQQVSLLSASLQHAIDARENSGNKAAAEAESLPKEASSRTCPHLSSMHVRPPPGLDMENQTIKVADEPVWRNSRSSSEVEPDPEPPRPTSFRAAVSSEPIVPIEEPSAQLAALSVVAVTLEDNVPCTRVEWRLEHVRAKLRANCGFPLVSPSFSISGMPPLRLMFVPGDRWAASFKGGNQQQRRRGGVSSGGSAYGTLKLKAGNVEGGVELTFYFTIGAMRLGPLRCDFGERVVQGCDLTEDWSTQVKPEGDQLCLGVDIIA